MKLNPVQVPIQTSPVAQSATSTGGAGGSVTQSPTQTGSVTQSPTQGAPAPRPAPDLVPKGQLDRTRDNLPRGWFNDGGHGGFKPAVIAHGAEGYTLAAVQHSDVPHGRR